MRTLGQVASFSLVCVALVACSGKQGPPGETGPGGVPGDPGTPAIITGTLAGTVRDGIAGDALAGVQVTAQSVGGAPLASATTGADGRFTLTVTAGAVDLSLVKPFYTSPGLVHTGVGIGQTTNLAIAMNEAASGRPSVALAAPADDVGYGATVALTATAGDPNGDALTYAWRNDTAPALGTVGGSGTSGSIATPTMAEAFAFRPDPTNPGQFISGYVQEAAQPELRPGGPERDAAEGPVELRRRRAPPPSSVTGRAARGRPSRRPGRSSPGRSRRAPRTAPPR